MQYSNTNFLFPPGLPVAISSITNFQSTDVSGLTVSNGNNFNVYAFKSAGVSYTINYTCAKATTAYVLAVGGGASGGGYWGGGGGAGGVVMATIPLPVTPIASTITISVGAGGVPNASVPYSNSGSSTSVSFKNLPYDISANGGGLAGQMGSTGNTGGNGGSGGGDTGYQPKGYGNSNQPTYSFATVYGNRGGSSVSTQAGGGGGAGSVGGDGGGASTRGGSGGNGVLCSLAGIKDFSPSGTTYGTYYWGGGGGGCGWGNSIGGGNGGSGGGGGGGCEAAYASLGGTGGINVGQPGIASGVGGDAGANTGGGGGGEWNQGAPGKGGSGIVVIAFQQ